MNKFYNIILSALLLSGVCASCSDENATEGEGRMKLSLTIDNDVKIVSRAVSAEEQASLEQNCTVYVYSTKGLVRKFHGVSELPPELWLVSGDYKAEAWAGDSVPASFTSKFYKGVTDFSITKGST